MTKALVLSRWLEKLQMTDLSRVVDDPAVWAPIHRIAGTLDKALLSCSRLTMTSGLRPLVGGFGRRTD
ncbi:hypothetical protein [Streptomyces sp. 11-1-2]|uniref:hypothetical protein n=1 Tax=Streptomyces sp. 11-1-2 TaxID=1851167 RepID=UPI001F08C8DB|nr:hypothetical protein [Streptomyces sp. 11-1-2]